MKKILTFVLAFVLVFAIAAPALAITGDTSTEPATPKNAPVALGVELFTAPEALGYGGLHLSQIAANKAYIVNELAFWGVALNFAKAPLSMALSDYQDCVLTLTSDAVAFDTVVRQYTQDGANDVVASGSSLLTIDLNNVGSTTAGDLDGFFNNATAAQKVYFFGQGVVVGKGVVTAELEKAPVWPLLINDANGDLLYTVGASTVVANGYDVTDADGYVVTFEVAAATDFVTDIYVDGAPILFYVPVSGGGSVVQAIGGLVAGDAGFAEAKAAYDAVMAFFGFNYDAKGRLLDKHFEAKFSGLYLKDEVAVQLYTADIVIPGGVVPPKTGDTASIMGFVMIVLAIVAAGVVVSRKVRA